MMWSTSGLILGALGGAPNSMFLGCGFGGTTCTLRAAFLFFANVAGCTRHRGQCCCTGCAAARSSPTSGSTRCCTGATLTRAGTSGFAVHSLARPHPTSQRLLGRGLFPRGDSRTVMGSCGSVGFALFRPVHNNWDVRPPGGSPRVPRGVPQGYQGGIPGGPQGGPRGVSHGVPRGAPRGIPREVPGSHELS